MRVPHGTVLTVALAVALLGTLVVVAPPTKAVAEVVAVVEGDRNVLQGDSVRIDVAFGTGDQQEVVSVTCPDCDDTWRRAVEWDDDKPNCRRGPAAQRICTISFPEGFQSASGGPSAAAQGEPSNRNRYTVFIGNDVTEQTSDTFEAWLATTHTCRDGEAWRSDVLLFSSSGHAAGRTIRLQVRDLQTNELVLDQRRTSAGPQVAYHFVWEVPLDYPLGSANAKDFRVTASSGAREEVQTFQMLPASPVAQLFAAPGGGDQSSTFNRTEDVQYWFRLLYLAAPQDCSDVSAFRRILSVSQEDLKEGALEAEVQKRNQATAGQEVDAQRVARLRAQYQDGSQTFQFNWTIPRGAEASRKTVSEEDQQDPDASPQYSIRVLRQELRDGNVIRPFNTTNFQVTPYDILPRVEVLHREVERLETAKVSFNLTYADGSPVTPRDLENELTVELKPVGDEPPVEVMALRYMGQGLWNATFEVDFEYEPLGEYQWLLRASEDRHGDPDHHNRIAETVTNIFRIVPARPVIDLQTFVGEQEVNGTERTRTVHVSLTAVYKNGVPLTSENVDPSLGGVVLNVQKKNPFGRVLDIDSLVMTDADGAGTWVRTFRIGRSADQAPAGTWDLEVLAGDDRDPSNRNETSFPFEVRPARLTVVPLVEPPDLVETEEVSYRVRIAYPDGTLFTEEMAVPDRGGEVEFALERVTMFNQTTPEVVQRPRSHQGGQEWSVSVPLDQLAPGLHLFNVTGRDIHGNTIGPHASRLFTVVFDGEFRNSTTPICPGGAGSPTEVGCSKQRGSEVFALFPKSPGDKGYYDAEPNLMVLRQLDSGIWTPYRQDAKIDDERFFELTGRDPGDHHIGYLKTNARTPTGTYMFFILGRNSDDSGFAGFSAQFNITAIEVERRVLTPLPSEVDKVEEVTAIIQKEPGDVIDEAFVRAGPVTFRNVEVTPTAVGTFVQWTPPRSVPVGPFSITVDGRDLFGNRFSVELGPTRVVPSQIGAQIIDQVPVEVERTGMARLQAKLTFPDGQEFTRGDGRPTVQVLDSQGNVVAEGQARHVNRAWVLEWQPPFDTPLGRYRLQVSGADAAGNIIDPFTSQPFTVVEGRVDAERLSTSSQVLRGQTAQARLRFPGPVQSLDATVTTGTESIGEPQVRIDGQLVTLTFPTDRTTELVQAQFHVEGEDTLGNRIDMDTARFRVNPQQMQVRFLRQPPELVDKGQRVIVDFVMEYPDGSRMRRGEGVPVVGLFSDQTALGPVRPEELNNQPGVWRIRWDPPDDARTDIPYRFAVSGLDRWQNEALPGQTRGFIILNPMVPDYLPTPGPSPLLLLGMLGAASLLLRRWRPRP